MKLPLLPRWKKHKPAVATHTPAVKKAKKKAAAAAIPVHHVYGAHASSAPAAAQLAVREKEAVERKRRATEEVEVDLSAVLPVPDTARAAHHHDCNDRDAWLAEHAYLVHLRAASVASPTHHDSDACTTTTVVMLSRASRSKRTDDAPPY